MKHVVAIFSRRDRVALTLVGVGAMAFWSMVIILVVRAFSVSP
jgi:hypothetical protein